MSNATKPAPTVAVIGGGYAGMAAAVTLADASVRCTVFEAGKTLGGRARRIEYRGEVIDNGQHILAGAYTELLRLMQLVGVPDSSLRRVPLTLSIPPDFLLRARRTPLLPGPLYMGWALLASRGLTISDRLAAIRMILALKRAKFQIGGSKSVATFLAEQTQPQNLIDHLWQPLTISALNTPLASASAQIFANVLRDSLASSPEASDLLLPRVDLTALFPGPAAVWLAQKGSEVRTGVRIQKILFTNDQYKVFSGAASQYFDVVILAVGPHQLEGLVTEIKSPALAYEPIVTLYFKFDQPVRLDELMVGQIDGLAQWFFDRRALGSNASSLHDGGGGLIAAVVSASGPHELLPQETLADCILSELKRHIPDLPAPAWCKVVSEKFATFACTPDVVRPDVTTSNRGIFRAGDYVAGDYPATLEGAVRNGISAAQESIAYLQTVEPIT